MLSVSALVAGAVIVLVSAYIIYLAGRADFLGVIFDDRKDRNNA